MTAWANHLTSHYGAELETYVICARVKSPDVPAWGNPAEFNVLDTRQYRDDQPNGERFNSSPSEESRNPNRTMTGPEQERWLLDGLGGALERLAQQVFFAKQDVRAGEGVGINPDAWGGYAGQRDRLVDFFGERGVANPIVLTGDVHANWASALLDDFELGPHESELWSHILRFDTLIHGTPGRVALREALDFPQQHGLPDSPWRSR